MAAKVITFLCLSMAVFNVAKSQAINRILPIGESILSNQVFVNQPCPNQILYNPPCPCQNQVILPNNQLILPQNQLVLPQNQLVLPNNQLILPQNNQVILPQPCQNQVLLNQPYAVEAVTPTTTVIQDSTVANNLANALQLLVVSNLLSNTLPNPVEYAPLVAAPTCGCGLPAYNVLY